jgi:hypothetical protein
MVKTATEFNSAVTFGGVSIGDATARISVHIDRKNIALKTADQLFCERRLIGKVVLGLHDEGTTQGKLIDDVDHEVAGAFDVKGFRCSADYISLGATFSLKEIDIAELARFSKGAGRLIVSDVGEIPEEPKEKPAPVAGTLKVSVSGWKKTPLDRLFDPDKAIRKALNDNNLQYVGELTHHIGAGKKLTDLDGITEKRAADIAQVLEQFWLDNPEAAEEFGAVAK